MIVRAVDFARISDEVLARVWLVAWDVRTENIYKLRSWLNDSVASDLNLLHSESGVSLIDEIVEMLVAETVSSLSVGNINHMGFIVSFSDELDFRAIQNRSASLKFIDQDFDPIKIRLGSAHPLPNAIGQPKTLFLIDFDESTLQEFGNKSTNQSPQEIVRKQERLSAIRLVREMADSWIEEQPDNHQFRALSAPAIWLLDELERNVIEDGSVTERRFLIRQFERFTASLKALSERSRIPVAAFNLARTLLQVLQDPPSSPGG